MKEMKKIILSLSILLILTLNLISVTAADFKEQVGSEQSIEENSKPLFYFVANKNQLEVMDVLAKENPNISQGEVLQKIAPDLWRQLPDMVKKTLYNSRFKENEDYKENYNKSTTLYLEQISYGSEIRRFGNSLEFSSVTNIPQGISWEYCITTTRLGDIDNVSHGYDFRVDSYENNSNGGTFRISAVLDPPSGSYRTFGNHLIANSETAGYEFISTSPWIYYLNPYE
jgi:hypothetical protein